MAYIPKKNDWESHLQYSITFSPNNDEWRKIARHKHDICYGDPILRQEVKEWLIENIGDTTDSPWHKDAFHPPKPKWYCYISKEKIGFSWGYYCIIKFLFEEDLVAFKLRWV